MAKRKFLSKAARILFVCHALQDAYGKAVGLRLSAELTALCLAERGIPTKVVSVLDGNGIDREIHLFQPTHALIEAIWATPAKMAELKKLHPSTELIVYVHSKTPFLANEGNALEYLLKYDVAIAANSIALTDDLSFIGIDAAYLPNVYFMKPVQPWERSTAAVNIGCFGAIRPMKNTLIQALAAIEYADRAKKPVNFHVNTSRVEQHGNSVVRNLLALEAAGKLKLVQHGWLPHEEFLQVVSAMDMGLQVSLSESFNIVTADFVQMGTPIVVSSEVSWMPDNAKADCGCALSILNAMERQSETAPILNRRALLKYNKHALNTWMNYLED